MSWSRPVVRAVAGLAALVLLVGCGSSSPPNTRDGAGGVRYQWPPTHTAVAPGQDAFCRLLIDDYQHLKSLTSGMSTAVKDQVLRDFAGFTPTLVAVAPASIAPATSTYVTAEGDLVATLARPGFSVPQLSAALATLRSTPVATAGRDLAAWSKVHCGYDPAADPALASG